MKVQVPFSQVAAAAAAALGSMLALAVFNAFLIGLLVKLLWNWLVPIFIPTLPIVQHITYWQGWGIVFLVRILSPKAK